MKIAVIADLHLTGCRKAVKANVLEWLKADLRQQAPDLLMAIGDLTALGTEDQNSRMLAYIQSLGLPWCSTPGNAEFRTNVENAAPWYVAPPANMPVILVDSANYKPPEADLQALAALPDKAGYLLGTHVPPESWPEGAKQTLSMAMARGAVTALIAGHKHNDGKNVMRGLDPDKAAGGPPMYEIWSNDAGKWCRSIREMASADIRSWPRAEREKLFSQFGVCTMWETLEAIESARQLRIPHLELREGALLELPEASLLEALNAWRDECGKCLSLHLPNLTAKDDKGALLASAERALRLRCQRVTLHVPAVTAVAFPAQKEQLLANFLTRMKPLLDAPVDIGIENLHTYPGKTDDEQRNYGCTIAECRDWIEALRNATGNARIGFHMDIGHARNNAPFNSLENLSDYYVEMGPIANGCHFHQVISKPAAGDSGNHNPFTGLYTKMISLAGYFLAWRAGQFVLEPPVFLEIRGKGLGIQNYNTLKHLILGEEAST